MRAAFLGIGSNIGGREENVLASVGMLGDHGRVLACSSLYETAPVDCPPQGRFINMVIELATELRPWELLAKVKEIEERMGRKGGHNEPRKIDIDIIAMEGIILTTEELTIPHARYHERAFVLVPLREIAPDFVCPVRGRTLDAMLEEVDPGQRVEPVSSRTAVFI